MENVYFNLDSIQSQYGENVLTAVIQMDERIKDLDATHEALNDLEKLQVVDRLKKIATLNTKIQQELSSQLQKINKIQDELKSMITPG